MMKTRAELETDALTLGQMELIERARRSMLGFTLWTKPDYEISWHNRLLCRYLDRFVAGEIKRLMVFMPPRHGKSELVSRRLPAYIMGVNPKTSIIACSYGADLASRMNRDVQRIIDSEQYRRVFPDSTLFGDNVRTVATGSWLRNSDIFEIVGHGGVYRSAGVGGAITGMGADVAIIDDPIKNQEEADSPIYRERLWEWYTSTLYTRLEREGRVLVTLTRWHEDDLAGRLLALAGSDPSADQWVVLRLPAIRDTLDECLDDPRNLGAALWPAKYNEKRLAGLKASVGTRVWSALYQQRPTPGEGGELKREWWKHWRALPDYFDKTMISADLTFGNSEGADYCVFQAWGKRGASKYLLDQVRGRMDFPTQLQTFKNFCAKHPKIVEKVIEEKANGAALIATVKKEISGVVPFNPKTSKQSRVQAVSPEIEAGNVYLPDPSISPWVNDFVEEATAFPNAAHDDQVDAMSQALIRFQTTAVSDFTEDYLQTDGGTVVPSLHEDSW